MPTSAGPNTKGEENLVFGYDLADVSNSYIGPPSKNQFAYTLSNGYLTNYYPARATGNENSSTNGWGHWGETGVLGNYGVNTDPNFIYTQGNTYSHYFSAASNSTVPYLCYQVLPFEGQQKGSVVAVWGGGNPNNKPRTLTYILKLHDSSEITKEKVYPSWNAHVSYYPSPGSSNTSPAGSSGNTQTPWTSITHIRDGWYKCVAANFLQSGQNDLTGIYVMPGYTCYIGFAQQEEQPVSTQLMTGTRSATQGLLDLTGNSTIDLTNVSFDSNAQMTFDGSDDYISLGDLGLGAGPFTVSALIYPTLASTYHVFFRKGDDGNSNDNMDWSMGYDYNQFHVRAQNASVAVNEYAGGSFVNSNGYVTLTYDGSTMRMYKNDTEVLNKAVVFANGYSNYSIGRGINNYANITVRKLSVYNRALTASEIKSNYNAIKGRFNIL